MSQGIELSELMSGSQKEQDAKFSNLVKLAVDPSDQELACQRAMLQARIIAFEQRYEMSSDSMLQNLSGGLVKETADICSWVMALKVFRGNANPA